MMEDEVTTYDCLLKWVRIKSKFNDDEFALEFVKKTSLFRYFDGNLNIVIKIMLFLQLNTFERIKSPHASAEELSDGVALCECLAEM